MPFPHRGSMTCVIKSDRRVVRVMDMCLAFCFQNAPRGMSLQLASPFVGVLIPIPVATGTMKGPGIRVDYHDVAAPIDRLIQLEYCPHARFSGNSRRLRRCL